MEETDVLLEIGCGIGNEIAHLYSYVKEVYGFDVSNTAIKYAKKRYEKIENVHLSVATDLNNYPDNFFDIIYSSTVLMHMLKKDVRKYFEESRNKIKDNGFIFMQFLHNPTIGKETVFVKGTKANPIANWSREEIIWMIAKSNLKIHSLSSWDISWQVRWRHPYEYLWVACTKPENNYMEGWFEKIAKE